MSMGFYGNDFGNLDNQGLMYEDERYCLCDPHIS